MPRPEHPGFSALPHEIDRWEAYPPDDFFDENGDEVQFVWDQSLLEWVLPGYHRDPDNYEWVKT